MSAAFIHRHRVTYASCTVGNHVYYSRYLDLAEEARGEFLRHLGVPLAQLQTAGFIFPVLEVDMKFHAAARYDDVLNVEITVTHLDRIRVHFGFRVLNEQGTPLVEGETRHVCTSLQDKPQRIPADLAAALRTTMPTDSSEAVG